MLREILEKTKGKEKLKSVKSSSSGREEAEFVSPEDLYRSPERFAGIISAGIDVKTGKVDLSYAQRVHEIMSRIYEDWPELLAKSLKKFAEKSDDKWFTFVTKEGYAFPVDVTKFIEGER